MINFDKTKEFCVIQDDEGHYYIVPADRKDAAEEWLAKAAKAIEAFDLTGEYEVLPKWIIEIDGIHTLVFKEWRETNGS